MEYIILEANTLNKLMAMVSEYIANGWRPQGGVAMAYVYEVSGYCQAMIRD